MSDRQVEAAVDTDVVVVGAGFAGLYLIHRLRQSGLRVTCFDKAPDVGGTWYWNRYPGARCDIPSIDYSYSFDADLQREWVWSEKYATQPEILRYINHVADRFDLRRDIRFGTGVTGADWNDADHTWTVFTDDGWATRCRWYVMATGCLSLPKEPEFAGADTFAGPVYSTSRWPHDGVDFSGQRVAVIGTGSSGIQSIPLIAQQASELTVFQRTANYSLPAHNGPVPEQLAAAFHGDPAGYREAARWTHVGVNLPTPATERVDQVDEAVREARFDDAWAMGHLLSASAQFSDLNTNEVANVTFAEYVRAKVRSIVADPETAEALSPRSFPFGSKRTCLDSGYYATFNQPHVRLVDLKAEPFVAITPTGVDTAARSYEFDAIVYATGFDAMTGAVGAVDIVGRDGVRLRDAWAAGPHTYLGVMSAGFPNLFVVTGPGSPSVLSNMLVSIEQHVEWISDCIDAMRNRGDTAVEPTGAAQQAWVDHVNAAADLTLFPKANSWYMGANVPGKPRVMLPYVAGVGTYRAICNDVAADHYRGFAFAGPTGTHTTPGVAVRFAPDVMLALSALAKLDLPTYESMSAPDARMMNAAAVASRPIGPDVGGIIDATWPGPACDLNYRLYRPPTPGPHPMTVYFHGGGWVLGNATSDDGLCRVLCREANTIVVSVDYRHGPEWRFPAAHDDALAAVRWVGEHALAFGGNGGPLGLAGWSAGANLATVTCARIRDEGGPAIAAQAMFTPVTDTNMTTGSYVDNATGYALTASLMQWFISNYVDGPDRFHPYVTPLHSNLAGLAPAIVVTCEFDPLRDEGDAYAAALAAAGVAVTHIRTNRAPIAIQRRAQINTFARIRTQVAHTLGDLLAR